MKIQIIVVAWTASASLALIQRQASRQQRLGSALPFLSTSSITSSRTRGVLLGSSMDDLAKEWAERNRDDSSSFMSSSGGMKMGTAAPMVAPPAPAPAAAPAPAQAKNPAIPPGGHSFAAMDHEEEAARERSSAYMRAKEWVTGGRNVSPPPALSRRNGAPSPSQPRGASSVATSGESDASSAATSGEMKAEDAMSRLAREWAAMNRDSDSLVKESTNGAKTGTMGSLSRPAKQAVSQPGMHKRADGLTSSDSRQSSSSAVEASTNSLKKTNAVEKKQSPAGGPDSKDPPQKKDEVPRQPSFEQLAKEWAARNSDSTGGPATSSKEKSPKTQEAATKPPQAAVPEIPSSSGTDGLEFTQTFIAAAVLIFGSLLALGSTAGPNFKSPETTSSPPPPPAELSKSVPRSYDFSRFGKIPEQTSSGLVKKITVEKTYSGDKKLLAPKVTEPKADGAPTEDKSLEPGVLEMNEGKNKMKSKKQLLNTMDKEQTEEKPISGFATYEELLESGKDDEPKAKFTPAPATELKSDKPGGMSIDSKQEAPLTSRTRSEEKPEFGDSPFLKIQTDRAPFREIKEPEIVIDTKNPEDISSKDSQEMSKRPEPADDGVTSGGSKQTGNSDNPFAALIDGFKKDADIPPDVSSDTSDSVKNNAKASSTETPQEASNDEKAQPSKALMGAFQKQSPDESTQEPDVTDSIKAPTKIEDKSKSNIESAPAQDKESSESPLATTTTTTETKRDDNLDKVSQTAKSPDKLLIEDAGTARNQDPSKFAEKPLSTEDITVTAKTSSERSSKEIETTASSGESMKPDEAQVEQNEPAKPALTESKESDDGPLAALMGAFKKENKGEIPLPDKSINNGESSVEVQKANPSTKPEESPTKAQSQSTSSSQSKPAPSTRQDLLTDEPQTFEEVMMRRIKK